MNVRRAAVAVAAVALSACATSAIPPSPPTATLAQVERALALDERCARATVAGLIGAMNANDERSLGELLAAASVTLPGRPSYPTANEAVAVLLQRSRLGERWSLTRLDVNGRGWDGGVHFGVYLRRDAPDLGSRQSAGKGVILCPEGRFAILGISDG